MKPILQCFSIIFFKNKDVITVMQKNLILITIMPKNLFTLKISFSLRYKKMLIHYHNDKKISFSLP